MTIVVSQGGLYSAAKCVPELSCHRQPSSRSLSWNARQFWNALLSVVSQTGRVSDPILCDPNSAPRIWSARPPPHPAVSTWAAVLHSQVAGGQALCWRQTLKNGGVSASVRSPSHARTRTATVMPGGARDSDLCGTCPARPARRAARGVRYWPPREAARENVGTSPGGPKHLRGRRDFSRFDPRPERAHFGAVSTVSGHVRTLSHCPDAVDAGR